jgi:membrane protein
MGDVPAPASHGRSWLGRAVRAPLGLLQKLVAVVPQAIDGYFADRLGQHAAAIAYRVLFSLAPLAIVLVSVFGLVLQDDQVREDVIDWIVDWVPVSNEGSADIERAITKIASPSSALGLVSLLVFAWASTGMMAALRTGLEAAMKVDRRPAARAKLVDFILVAATGALVLVVIGVSIASQVVTRLATELSSKVGLEGGAIDVAVRTGVPLLLILAVVILLYRFVPAHRMRFRDTIAGALMATVLLLAISAASAYIYDKTARLSVIYGSITVALVFLYSVYLYASALLFGAEVAAAWSRPPQGPGDPIVVQVKRAVLGLFVKPPEPDERPAGYQAPGPGGSGSSGGRTT